MPDMTRLRIDELLEEKGITAYRLALSAELSHSTIWQLRHNKVKEIKLDVIEKICNVLGCGPGELIEINAPEKPAKKKR